MSDQQPRLPQRPAQHQVADESVRFFGNSLPRGWTHEERKNDYGIDVQVGIVRDNFVTGEELLVQLKSTSRIEPPGDSVAIELEVSTLNMLRNMLQVVLLVKYVQVEKEAYWLLLKDYSGTPDPEQKTVTIRLPRANRVSSANWEQIAAHVAAVHYRKLAANRGEPYGKALASGLKAEARITNGFIRYDECSVPARALIEMLNTIKGGSIKRAGDGRIVAALQTLVPVRALQELNARLGLDAFPMTCTDPEISVEAAQPSVFVLNGMRTHIPAGESILNLETWREIILPAPVEATTQARAIGAYNPRTSKFTGRFEALISYQGIATTDVALAGAFEIELA